MVQVLIRTNEDSILRSEHPLRKGGTGRKIMIMNKKQLIIMWIGIAVFIYFGLTTKTHYTYRQGRINPVVAVTDYGPMTVRLVSTVLVTGGLIYTFKDKKPKDSQKQ